VTQAAQHADAVGQQFYVTHCTIADSVLNNPGYTVRAASPGDESLLEKAFHYPPYELPIEMWKDLPPVDLTPRRLARTEHGSRGGGGVWVVHSTYLAKDTAGRDRSYFSHLLLLPSADPAAVLKSWDSEGWAKSYPPGAPKELKREDAKLPVGSLVSDDALTKFLNDTPPGRTELGMTVCPARLRTSAADRRDLFARVLQAILLLDAEKDEDRRRLYIHAEPGLIALLLYGAVRLLPSQVVGNLTFSTFEPYHRNIREYKFARVVGTFTGNAEKGLDSDLGTSRGVALDTVKPSCSSPELRDPLAKSLPEGVRALVELAQRGEWHLLPSVKHSVGAQASGLPKAGKALLRARGLARVDAGQATINELLQLQEDKLAADELKTRTEKVWPVVKAAALDPAREDVRKAFAELIAQPEHVESLWSEGFEALLKEDYRTWDSRWAVLRSGATEVRKVLQKSIGSKANEGRLARLPTEVRAKLRAACADAGILPPRPLLVPIGVGELNALLASSPAQAGVTAFALLAKDNLGYLKHVPAADRAPMRQKGKDFLFGAPPAAISAYVQAARDHLDSDSHCLDVLFKPYSANGAKLMDKLLIGGALEPADWMRLTESVKLTQDQWGDYLLENGRLANLLVGLGGEGVGKDVWAVYLSSLTAAVVSPDVVEGDNLEDVHAWERKVHANLKAAAERLTKGEIKLAAALPEGGVARLFAANNLVKWVDDPASAERDGADEVKHACAIYELEPILVVRVAYRKGGYARRSPETETPAFAPIVSLFRTCFPVDGNFNTARRAVTEAIRLSRSCPEALRGELQALLIQSCVPDIHFQAILGAEWREPLHPYAAAKLGERMKKGAKKGGPRYVAPLPASASEAVPVVDSPFDDESDESSEPDPVIERKRAKRMNNPGGYSRSRGKSKGNMLVWVLLLLLAVGALGGGIYVVINMAKNKNAPTQPTQPTQPEPPKPTPPPAQPKVDPKKGKDKDTEKST
jgi:hypothetical protein